MVFSHSESFAQANALEGYERLILLAMSGDQALFTRSDGIERLWEVSAPLLETPRRSSRTPRGSWGPESVTKLIAPDRWHLPES
jgi:glucose-6-phosphate 1-dehydrogenase